MTKLRRRLAQEERKPRLAELTDWPTALRELVEEDEEGRGEGRPGTGTSSPAPHARGQTPYPLTRSTGAPPAAAWGPQVSLEEIETLLLFKGNGGQVPVA